MEVAVENEQFIGADVAGIHYINIYAVYNSSLA